MATGILIVRKLTEVHPGKTRIKKESLLYNVVIILSVTSIKNALIDKNMLSIKKKSLEIPLTAKKKKCPQWNIMKNFMEIYMKM